MPKGSGSSQLGCDFGVIGGIFFILLLIGILSDSDTRPRPRASRSVGPPPAAPTASVTRATGSWTTDIDAATGARRALSAFAMPTVTGEFAGHGSAGIARVGVACIAPNHVVGIALPQGIAMQGSVPVQIEVDGRPESMRDAIMAQNVMIIGSTENGLVDRLRAGNQLRVRMGQAGRGFMTWVWSLSGSRSAIQRACG